MTPDRSDHPNGGSPRSNARRTLSGVILLEIGLLVLSVVSFYLLDRYVIGCEKI